MKTEEKPHILYVDDHDDTREMVTTMLEVTGIDVTEVENGVDCIEQLKSRSYDLVLLDHTLPDLSGVSLCEIIRDVDKDVPILFYSARAFPEEIDHAMGCGANGYLIKPNDTDRLTDEVWKLVRQGRRMSG